MVRIILNADDFGKSLGRNRAIDYSFKKGLICSAGLIVTGKHLDDAVDYIKKGNYVEHIHLHLNFSANLLREESDDAPLTEVMQADPFFCNDGKFIPYKGLPHKFSDIRKWKVVYREIIAQYQKFMEVTDGKADYKHIDCHLWYNLTWPVSIALNLFTRKYRIQSARYIGLHQMNSSRNRLYRALCWTPRVKEIPATNIDYFLSKKDLFSKYDIVELYCHPHYKNDIFLDDSPSYLKHERQPMLKHIQLLKNMGDFDYVSWANVFDDINDNENKGK